MNSSSARHCAGNIAPVALTLVMAAILVDDIRGRFIWGTRELKEVLAEADAALYTAKHTGRNKVVCSCVENA